MDTVEKQSEIDFPDIDSSTIKSPLGRDEIKAQIIPQEKIIPQKNTSLNSIKAPSTSQAIQKTNTVLDKENTVSESSQ
jgi:hypothetical protein